jgi:hypothetical protein
LSTPQCCFFFRLFAEEAHPEEGSALFILSEMTLDAVDQLALILAGLGERKGLAWIPIWRFNDQISQIKVEQDVDRLLATGRPTNIIISTSDMERFTGCWCRVR